MVTGGIISKIFQLFLRFFFYKARAVLKVTYQVTYFQIFLLPLKKKKQIVFLNNIVYDFFIELLKKRETIIHSFFVYHIKLLFLGEGDAKKSQDS